MSFPPYRCIWYFYNTHTAACRQWQIRLILRAFSVKSAQVCTAGADCLWKSAKYSMLAVLHFAAGTAHNGRRLAPLQKGGESHAKTSATPHNSRFAVYPPLRQKAAPPPGVAKKLDNVGVAVPAFVLTGAKAPRTLRPLPLLRFAVSAKWRSPCSIQYYLRFWLGICRTSLAVSALRIMRYCPLTFHVLGLPIAVTVKSKNRHPGRTVKFRTGFTFSGRNRRWGRACA